MTVPALPSAIPGWPFERMKLALLLAIEALDRLGDTATRDKIAELRGEKQQGGRS